MPPRKPTGGAGSHLPKVIVVTTKVGGYGTTEIKCLGCPFTTGALGSKKDAWEEFRAHYKDQTTPTTQPATAEEAQML